MFIASFGSSWIFDFLNNSHIWEYSFYPSSEEAPDEGPATPLDNYCLYLSNFAVPVPRLGVIAKIRQEKGMRSNLVKRPKFI